MITLLSLLHITTPLNSFWIWRAKNWGSKLFYLVSGKVNKVLTSSSFQRLSFLALPLFREYWNRQSIKLFRLCSIYLYDVSIGPRSSVRFLFSVECRAVHFYRMQPAVPTWPPADRLIYYLSHNKLKEMVRGATVYTCYSCPPIENNNIIHAMGIW